MVDATAFVFIPAAAPAWKHRLDTLCGRELEASTRWVTCRSTWAGSYPAIAEFDARAADGEFESCWVVTKNDSYDLQERYSNGEYTVSEITAGEHC